MIERPTRLLLQAAGLTKGMRVLDLGTGLGHVARLAGELVGPTGSVTGLDQSPRCAGRGPRSHGARGNDTRRLSWTATSPPGAAPNRSTPSSSGSCSFTSRIRPRSRGTTSPISAGAACSSAIEFDLGGARAEPPVALMDEGVRWVEAAFRAAGAWPRIGARLGVLLDEAGFTRVSTFGVQAYLPPSDPVRHRDACGRRAQPRSGDHPPRHRDGRAAGVRRRSSSAWPRPSDRPAA